MELARRMAAAFPDAVLNEHTLLSHFADPTAAARIHERFLTTRLA
jgi:hypothetical protein